MLSKDTAILCKEVTKISKRVGKYILNERKKLSAKNIETKGLNDFVTHVDKTSERKLVEALSNLLPEAGFITEEKTINKVGKKYNWVIDPLDGTTNFIHGLPCFCISIALMEGKKVILGVVHELNFDECFYAWKGGPAFLNGEKINVSGTKTLSGSLMATGFPYTNYDRMEEYLDVFRYCMQHTHGLRRLGSAAADLAYLACGRFEGFYEYGLNPWDVAAGVFIVERAGGKTTDFKGGNNYIFGKELVTTNKRIHNEFMEVIKRFM